MATTKRSNTGVALATNSSGCGGGHNAKATLEVTWAKPIYSTVFNGLSLLHWYAEAKSFYPSPVTRGNRDLSYHISIPTHDHVVDPKCGVRGVIQSKQEY